MDTGFVGHIGGMEVMAWLWKGWRKQARKQKSVRPSEGDRLGVPWM